MSKYDDLVEEAEKTAEMAIGMRRDIHSDLDEKEKAAFAFVLGTEVGDVMVVSGDISGDGKELPATVTTYIGGEPADVPAAVTQVGNSVLITSPIQT